jgi:hypothetical protein
MKAVLKVFPTALVVVALSVPAFAQQIRRMLVLAPE